MLKAIPYFLLLATLMTGCSYLPLPSWPWATQQLQPNPTAEALFDEGMTYFRNKKYALAVDRLQRVKTEFPFSPQVISAELKIAEAYHLNKQYPEAVAAFKEFHDLHPTNENIAFVVYHLGLAHFDQFTSTDRDQKLTEIAKGYFETVVRNHPNSPYAGPAREKLAKCLEYLAEHEFNIAAFYLRERKYPAAIDRFEGILRRFPDAVSAPKALYQLGESYQLDKNTVKAALAYEALIQHYPESPLAKEARTQLGQLAKERQDPLAMLLKRDSRPAYNPPAEINQQLASSSPQKELNLVAKKEVVQEEPGAEKGMFRRVMDTLNPFASSSAKKENDDKKTESPKGESPGLFSSLWRGMNPFGKEAKSSAETAKNSQLVGKIDESLKQKGIDTGSQNLVARPPADLPKIEEPTPPATDPAVILGEIDAKLKKEGKNVAELPPPPEAAPVLRASAAEGRKPASSKADLSPSAESSGLIANIDEALKRKGIQPAKLETTSKSAETSPAPRREEKVDLAPRLSTEKQPFFLDPKEYEPQGKEEAREASRSGSAEASQPSSPPTSQASQGLPQAVVKGPPQPQKENPVEIKTVERKKTEPGDEENKGVLDQLREELGRLGSLLNPFKW